MNKLFLILVTFAVTCMGCRHLNATHPTVVRDTVIVERIISPTPKFITGNPKECLREALDFYEVSNPDIVYAQAVLETGNFTSGGCKKDNNLFGIMNKSGHAKFNHWTESVVAYKNWIQYKHRPNENYFCFLKRIGYAEDPNYTIKLRKILARNCENQKKN